MLNPLPADDAGDAGDRDFAPLSASMAQTHGGLADLDPWDERPGPPPRVRREGGFRLESIAESLEVAALALFMFIAVRGVAQNYIVDGGSMLPNFHNGELVIVNKLAFRTFDISWLPFSDDEDWQPFGEPTPGDVVVFTFPQDPTRDFIKRVIAGPGQTVEVRDGTVFVDDVALDEPYLSEPPVYEYGPEVVPPGDVFVLGDNRNNSYDSHSWGMLPQDAIIGRAELRYWPLSQAGLIDQHRHEFSAIAEVSSSR